MKKKRTAGLLCAIMAISMIGTLGACGKKRSENDAPGLENVEDSTAQTEESSATAGYADKLFDTSYVHMIDIRISEEDWKDLAENPLEKTKYKVDITIDGETIEAVSFATKGNTSLSMVASDQDSDRYSFKVNFGKYTDDQTYYGLNKLNLNNIYADATYMKDYLSYELFRQAGVDAPLTSYVWLTINGEDHGLYLAIEDISEGYLERTNDGEGELYKPESESQANMGNAPDMERPDGANPPDGMMPPGNGSFPDNMTPPGNGERPEMPDGVTPPENGERPEMPDGVIPPGNGEWPDMPDGGNGMPGENTGFGDSENGAALTYTDDEISSYSDIFDNDETNADDESKARVIAALKGLSEGKDLENYLDTNEIISYFVAHNFVLNYDSYTGNMLHNYYLYENDGKLSMLPWDYNLAFGGFSGGGPEGSDATSLVNTGIDSPLSGANEDSRPMWSWIVSDEKYLEAYHNAYDSLISGYFESGEFEAEIDAVYEMIYPYVEKDPSAFYTVDEFHTAYETLKQFCLLRAESIRMQLNGTLATKTAEQDSSKQVNASGINTRDMGSFLLDK